MTKNSIFLLKNFYLFHMEKFWNQAVLETKKMKKWHICVKLEFKAATPLQGPFWFNHCLAWLKHLTWWTSPPESTPLHFFSIFLRVLMLQFNQGHYSLPSKFFIRFILHLSSNIEDISWLDWEPMNAHFQPFDYTKLAPISLHAQFSIPIAWWGAL
jgi:hypothetical protein